MGRVILLSCFLAGCTEPNPGYEGPRDEGVACTPGGRACGGQNVLVCVPKAGAATYEVERACPNSSTCKAGICVPGAGACSGGCEGGLVCTIFVNPSSMTSLGTYCAKPVGAQPGGSPCGKNAECQSGFCIARGKTPTCYQACGKSGSCGPMTKCVQLMLTVDGVQGTVTGCVNN